MHNMGHNKEQQGLAKGKQKNYKDLSKGTKE
jgi:hypothetical protein